MKIFLAIFSLLTIHISCFAIAQDKESVDRPNYTVIINNTCHQDIRVAIHYEHPERGWVTQGWWQVGRKSELSTGLSSSHNQFYMHGTTSGVLQWPPKRTSKQYNRYSVMEDDYLIVEAEQDENQSALASFSLKEISPTSKGLKARFDC